MITSQDDRDKRVWQALERVMDPEIPTISVVDLGVIRDVQVDGDGVRVTMTPTFAGCPALDVMRQEVRQALSGLGLRPVRVEVKLAPPWTTDWLTESGREKLRQFGLSPPLQHEGAVLWALEQPAICPYCGSSNSQRKNMFGSTLCRSIHVCNDCRQPFEAFKPL